MLRAGAQTPEELETLLEDAFVVGDADALAELFEDGGLLATGEEVCGGEAIGPLAAALWERDVGYVADPRRVVQAHDTALVVSERSIGVARRAGDGRWRYAIALLDVDHTTNEEKR
jgi:hypothetical protein